MLEEEHVLVKNFNFRFVLGKPEGVFFHGASEQECSLRISRRLQVFYPIKMPRSETR
jgi:hypothetical protein